MKYLLIFLMILCVSCSDDYIIYYGHCERKCNKHHKHHKKQKNVNIPFRSERWNDDTLEY